MLVLFLSPSVGLGLIVAETEEIMVQPVIYQGCIAAEGNCAAFLLLHKASVFAGCVCNIVFDRSVSGRSYPYLQLL